MSRSNKDACGCVHFTDKGREQVTLCSGCAAVAKRRHDEFVADMLARTAREKLAEQFV